jgi:hypothetical protein
MTKLLLAYSIFLCERAVMALKAALENVILESAREGRPIHVRRDESIRIVETRRAGARDLLTPVESHA